MQRCAGSPWLATVTCATRLATGPAHRGRRHERLERSQVVRRTKGHQNGRMEMIDWERTPTSLMETMPSRTLSCCVTLTEQFAWLRAAPHSLRRAAPARRSQRPSKGRRGAVLPERAGGLRRVQWVLNRVPQAQSLIVVRVYGLLQALRHNGRAGAHRAPCAVAGSGSRPQHRPCAVETRANSGEQLAVCALHCSSSCAACRALAAALPTPRRAKAERHVFELSYKFD